MTASIVWAITGIFGFIVGYALGSGDGWQAGRNQGRHEGSREARAGLLRSMGGACGTGVGQ